MDDDSPALAQEQQTQRRMIGVLIVVAGALAMVALAVWAYNSQGSQSDLFPSLPSPTAPALIISADVEEVTFAALNENPANYLNKTIQATGTFTPLELPNCRPFAGPVVEWSLVGDNLQLNAKGYENVLRLAEPGMQMTVVGVWRLYSGPVGCGKEPPSDVVWYLDVSRIIEPNPLFGGPQGVLTFVPGEVVTAESARPTLEATPQLAPTAVFATEEGLAPTTAGTPPENGEATPSPTATDGLITPLATPSAEGTPPPTVAGTPNPNATPTATPDGSATATSEPTGSETPALPTATQPSNGYPPASPTSESYP